MATLQGAKVFDINTLTFLILLGVSALVILVFYIYHENIHQWIEKMSKAGIRGKKWMTIPHFPEYSTFL